MCNNFSHQEILTTTHSNLNRLQLRFQHPALLKVVNFHLLTSAKAGNIQNWFNLFPRH